MNIFIQCWWISINIIWSNNMMATSVHWPSTYITLNKASWYKSMGCLFQKYLTTKNISEKCVHKTILFTKILFIWVGFFYDSRGSTWWKTFFSCRDIFGEEIFTFFRICCFQSFLRRLKRLERKKVFQLVSLKKQIYLQWNFNKKSNKKLFYVFI